MKFLLVVCISQMENEASRRQQKSAMAHTRLELAHTQNCALLPDRLHLLDRLPKGAKVAEIGVGFGDFSQEILARCVPEKLFLIDAWDSPRYRDGIETIKQALAENIENGKVEVRRGPSIEILCAMPSGSFDWAYIDTNHTYETTLEELQLCDGIVGDAGRVSGHDFCTGNIVRPVIYGVVEAVTKFCKDCDWQFEFLTAESNGHFSFCLKRLRRA